MPTTLAIDPGNIETGWVLIDDETFHPRQFGISENYRFLYQIEVGVVGPAPGIGNVVIEKVASYGMPVGETVFDTCYWGGRILECAVHHLPNANVDLVKRLPVKVHHCHSAAAKDSNITQALVDRFAPGEGNHGKGTKKNPGFFYGFKKDIWAAYALGVYAIDTREERG